jgi:hypothetical protein
MHSKIGNHEMTLNYKKNGEEFWVNFALTQLTKRLVYALDCCRTNITEQKIKELENSLLAQISVDFKIENDYSIAVNELCKSISKIGNFDWVELWTSNLEKKCKLFSHYVAEIEDKRFYDYSPEFLQIKSLSYQNNLWSGGVQLLWVISSLMVL